jgi:hypothetical protein
MEVVGQLSEKEHQLLQEHVNKVQMLKFRIGDLVSQQHELLQQITEAKYEMKVQENKIVKKYGEDVFVDIKSGEIKSKKPVPMKKA